MNSKEHLTENEKFFLELALFAANKLNQREMLLGVCATLIAQSGEKLDGTLLA